MRLSGGFCEVGKMIGVMSRVLGGVYWERGEEGQLRESERSGQTCQSDQDAKREGEAGPVVGWPNPVNRIWVAILKAVGVIIKGEQRQRNLLV